MSAGGFEQFEGWLGENAMLAWDTINMKETKGIPSKTIHVMDIGLLEEVGGHAPGEYMKDPDTVYLDFQRTIGTCGIDQYLSRNPMTMTNKGYDGSKERGATTGAEEIVRDGIRIDSPEAVMEHMEKFVFPALERDAEACDPDDESRIDELIQAECDLQKQFGPTILNVPYGKEYNGFPKLRYGIYGYVNYFMAYALFPDVMEKDFKLQADLAVKRNEQAVKAYVKGGMPRLLRLDHDMADSRSTLVDIHSLDKIWFPHFARAMKPYVDAGIRLIWHCDGNLMDMVPRLLTCGLGGFQGFQYEDGMDYEAICKMKDRDGDPLLIWGGVSVTTTLPHGTTEDVKKEMRWLVENGPPVGFFLGGSSSIAPGTNRENVKTMIEGLKYYREHGREGGGNCGF